MDVREPQSKDEASRRSAMEWFERGDRDIETAQLLYDEQGYTDVIDLCEKATRHYLEERYPPGPPAEYSREEVKTDLALAWQLVKTIREKAES